MEANEDQELGGNWHGKQVNTQEDSTTVREYFLKVTPQLYMVKKEQMTAEPQHLTSSQPKLESKQNRTPSEL